MSYSQIARTQGVEPSSVWKFLKRFEEDRPSIEAFKANRADVFAGIQGRALEVQERVIDEVMRLPADGILEAMGPKAVPLLLGAVNKIAVSTYDRERLERGESTQNTSIMVRMLNSRASELYKPEQTVSLPNGERNQSSGNAIEPEVVARKTKRKGPAGGKIGA